MGVGVGVGDQRRVRSAVLDRHCQGLQCKEPVDGWENTDGQLELGTKELHDST